MLKGTKVVFVVWIISSFNILFAKSLNYLKLKSLRYQHYFEDHSGGSTRVKVNSSKRVFELIEALETEELSRISNEIDKAYNEPYRSTVNINQVIKHNKMIYGVDIYNSTVAELINPVFPEIEIFNIRSNSFWISKYIKHKNLILRPKLSFTQRWFIDEKYTLQDIINNNVDIKFQDTVPVDFAYFDLKVESSQSDVDFYFELIGLEITNNDRYKYYETLIGYKKNISKLINLGGTISPIFYGNYNVFETLSVDLRIIASRNTKLDFKLSQLVRKLTFKTDWKNLNLSLGFTG